MGSCMLGCVCCYCTLPIVLSWAHECYVSGNVATTAPVSGAASALHVQAAMSSGLRSILVARLHDAMGRPSAVASLSGASPRRGPAGVMLASSAKSPLDVHSTSPLR